MDADRFAARPTPGIRIAAILLPLIAACGFAPAWAQTPADVPALAGVVRDGLGTLVPGVEVLVGSPDSVEPLASVVSDARGRFAIADLAPGAYRFAAIKRGYRTEVGSVDTAARRWLDVVLRPGRTVDGDLVPRDRAWMLRAPRRSVFRELDAPQVDRPEVVPAVAGRDVSVRLDHLTGSTDNSGDEPEAMTDLSVASRLGEEGRIQLQGRRDRRDLSIEGQAREGGLQSSADDWALDFGHSTGLDSEVAVRAFYRHRSLGPQGAEGDQRGVTGWGCDSAWKWRLDDASQLDVGLDFASAEYDLTVTDGGEPGLQQTAASAFSRYRTVTGRHDVEASLRASHFQAEVDPTLTDARLAAQPGWTLTLDTEDRWSLSDRITLNSGLAYRHTVSAVDAAWWVPRFGARYTLGGLAVDAGVSLAESAGWEARLPPEGAAPSRRWGYLAQVEVPLFAGLRMRASTRVDPVLMDATESGALAASFGDGRPYRTDGNATRHESRVVVEHTSPVTTTYVEWIGGEVEGRVGAVRGLEPETAFLSDAAVGYSNGRVGVRYQPTGTDVRFEYRHVDAVGADEQDTSQDIFELRLVQELLRWDTFGRWRLLMALRLDELAAESSADETETPAEPAARVTATNRGLSAGLSVVF